MGLFKDLGDIKRQTKEMSRDSPGAGARFAEANRKMAAATSSLAVSTPGFAPPAPGSVPVQAQVLYVQPATGYINGDPIVAVSVLLLMAGTPPVPSTQSIVVPAMHLPRLQPGVRVAARVDPQDVQAFALDWNASL